MSNIKLEPLSSGVDATVDLVGSKSIANRVLLLSAIANGVSVISNIPEVSEDVGLMLSALQKLGVVITKVFGDAQLSRYEVHGCDGNFPVKSGEIFCGNSGTTIRFLVAVLSVMNGHYKLTCSGRMKERPISDLVNGLRQIGANISYLEAEGYPPLEIKPFNYNQNSHVVVNGSVSSQYISALLLALPLIKKQISIRVLDQLISKPYVDITLGVLNLFASSAIAEDVTGLGEIKFSISANSQLVGVDYTVEPDASSASYFLAMGAINGAVTIKNLSRSSLQGDKNFAKVLLAMGANVEYLSNAIRVSSGLNGLNGININMQDMPDVAMTLAVIGLLAKGGTTIRGIQSWKIKETDRLKAMYNELIKFGAEVSITDSSITIVPPLRIRANVLVDTYNDHRMAMAFSILVAGGIPVIINDYQCVGKTFANFFNVLSDSFSVTCSIQ